MNKKTISRLITPRKAGKISEVGGLYAFGGAAVFL
jgi:hypothetical protein